MEFNFWPSPYCWQIYPTTFVNSTPRNQIKLLNNPQYRCTLLLMEITLEDVELHAFYIDNLSTSWHLFSDPTPGASHKSRAWKLKKTMQGDLKTYAQLGLKSPDDHTQIGRPLQSHQWSSLIPKSSIQSSQSDTPAAAHQPNPPPQKVCPTQRLLLN